MRMGMRSLGRLGDVMRDAMRRGSWAPKPQLELITELFLMFEH